MGHDNADPGFPGWLKAAWETHGWLTGAVGAVAALVATLYGWISTDLQTVAVVTITVGVALWVTWMTYVLVARVQRVSDLVIPGAEHQQQKRYRYSAKARRLAIFGIIGGLVGGLIAVTNVSGPAPTPEALDWVEIVLDRSIGMNETYPDGTTKWQVALDGVEEGLRYKVAEENSLALREFGGSCEGKSSTLVLDFAQNNEDNVRSRLAGIEILQGETTLGEAIVEAIGDMRRPELVGLSKRILVITSGIGTCALPERTTQEIKDRLKLLRDSGEDIRVDIRIYGLGIETQDEKEFLEIAKVTGGSAEFLDTPEESRRIAKGIAARGSRKGELRFKPETWVGALTDYARWAVAPTGTAELRFMSVSGRNSVDPGQYDVYIIQDKNRLEERVKVASGVEVTPGQPSLISDLEVGGLRLRLAEWVAPRKENGWWGVTKPGERVILKRTNHPDRLLVPPGTYDVWWCQGPHYADDGERWLIARNQEVTEGKVKEISPAGIRLEEPFPKLRLDLDAGAEWWGVWPFETRDALPETLWPLWHIHRFDIPILVPPGRYALIWRQGVIQVGRREIAVSPGALSTSVLELTAK